MTILAEIQAAFPGLTPETRDDGAIAAALSIGRVKMVSTLIGFGTVLEVLGPTDGAAALDALQAMGAQVSAVKWAMKLLDGSKLDIGLSSVQAQIDALTGPVFTPVQAAALKSLAVVNDPITEFDVRCALNDVQGNWLGS